MTDVSGEQGASRIDAGDTEARRGLSDGPIDASQIDFTCPRCGKGVTESFYGPCAACREELHAVLSAEPASASSVPSRRDPADEPDTPPSDTWIDNL